MFLSSPVAFSVYLSSLACQFPLPVIRPLQRSWSKMSMQRASSHPRLSCVLWSTVWPPSPLGPGLCSHFYLCCKARVMRVLLSKVIFSELCLSPRTNWCQLLCLLGCSFRAPNRCCVVYVSICFLSISNERTRTPCLLMLLTRWHLMILDTISICIDKI